MPTKTKEKKVTETAKTEPWEPAAEYLRPLFSTLQTNFETLSGQSPYPSFSGIAPINQTLQKAFDVGGNYADMVGSLYPGVLDKALSNTSMDPSLLPYLPNLNFGGFDTVNPNATLEQMMSATPAWDIYAPLMDQAAYSITNRYLQDVLPVIRADSINTGNFGQPSATEAEVRASQAMAGEIARSQERIIADMANQALNQRSLGAQLATQLYGLGGNLDMQAAQSQLGAEQDVNRLLANFAQGSLGLLPNLMAAGQLPLDVLNSIGTSLNAYDQALLDEQVQRYMQDLYFPTQTATDYSNLLAMLAGLGGTTTRSYPVFSASNPLADLAKAGLSGAMAYTMIANPAAAAANLGANAVAGS